ncbi:triose-phosphate isomerase [Neobacillus niacini]|uniref:triose-phosphate isomerase n=1 Tax=Neobacillus niacini TaxID=86668 RepID=UPI0039839047
MNKIWIGTNWKMHKSLHEGTSYTKELIGIVEELDSNVEVFIIPPYTSLWPIKDVVGSSRLKLGAQNMHWQEEGAYTGEISPMMLSEIGLDLVELGHSERRQYYNENDVDINKKAKAALRHGLKPLICIGENLQHKDHGITEEVISAQLKVTLQGISKDQVDNVLIAYEPVWAIGEAGKPAETDYVGKVHSHIRAILVELFGERGKIIPILFGGSVNQTNFMSYLENEDVNGLFIGRAAWNMESFREILSTIHGTAVSSRS